jgi:hypothetical protein
MLALYGEKCFIYHRINLSTIPTSSKAISDQWEKLGVHNREMIKSIFC